MLKGIENLTLRQICEILFDSAAEGLVVVDKTGSIHIVNPRLLEMFGYEQGELTGKSVELLIPESKRKQHSKHRHAYNKAPERRAMGLNRNLTAVKKDGTTFPVEVSLNHFEVDGQLLIMALISDITIRREAEKDVLKLNSELEKRVEERTREMEESQRLYKTIARNYPNGMISVFDRDLNYIFAEGMETFKIGITSEQLKGTNYLKRLPEEIRDDIRTKLNNVFEGEDQNFELEVNKRNFMINAVGLTGPDGKVDQILVVQQNITRLKQAEEDIRQALLKEKHLNELKSRFVAMASHEFRTPLTTIMSSLTLLSKYIDQNAQNEKQIKHTDRIRSSVHHLTSMLNDFLSLDKLEDGKIQIHPTEFNVVEFALETADDIQESVRRGQTITYHHEGEELVNTDKSVFRNICNNLLSNAIKYSHDNGEVRFYTKLKGEELMVVVEDDGIGIPKDEQEHLFDRFFRAQNAMNIQGTGLGLNIVKKYIDLAGGQIDFSSEYEKGSVFTVTLPSVKLVEK